MQEGEESKLPKIASKNTTSIGDLVILDDRSVAVIIKTDEYTFTAKRDYTTYLRKYANSIILNKDGTYSVGENLLRR